MRARAFNPQIFLELLCYCFLGGLMLHLVSSGKYLTYVTPRMKPYLYFTVIIMLIWVFVSLFKVFRPQHKVHSAHCFVLAIPILLLLLPHSPLNTSEFAGNYLSGNMLINRSGQNLSHLPSAGSSGLNTSTSSPTDESEKSGTAFADDPSSIMEDESLLEDNTPIESIDTTASDVQMTDMPEDNYSTRLPGLDVANKKITVSNDYFSLWLSEIHMNTEKYVGFMVVMTGYVFKDPEILNENEFVPARLMMSCCVADLAPAGLLCKYDKAFELKRDSWVTVEGTLFIGQYEYGGQKYDDPQIKVIKITPAEEVEGYIYPY